MTSTIIYVDGYEEIDKLLSFLRLDKSRMQIQQLGVTLVDGFMQVVELTYIDTNTRQVKKCVIGVGDHKINEFATR